MGVFFTDTYSLLHFATGIILYYFGFSFLLIKWLINKQIYIYI